MSVTITATYDSIDNVRNAEDELRASGIPSENLYFDEAGMQIKVMIPATTRPQILEILERHKPTQLN